MEHQSEPKALRETRDGSMSGSHQAGPSHQAWNPDGFTDVVEIVSIYCGGPLKSHKQSPTNQPNGQASNRLLVPLLSLNLFTCFALVTWRNKAKRSGAVRDLDFFFAEGLASAQDGRLRGHPGLRQCRYSPNYPLCHMDSSRWISQDCLMTWCVFFSLCHLSSWNSCFFFGGLAPTHHQVGAQLR